MIIKFGKKELPTTRKILDLFLHFIDIVGNSLILNAKKCLIFRIVDRSTIFGKGGVGSSIFLGGTKE